MVVDCKGFVLEREGNHVHASDVPYAAHILVCRGASAGLAVGSHLRYYGVLLHLAVDHRHDGALCLGVEVLEAHVRRVGERRVEVRVTDYDVKRVRLVGDGLQLCHRRLRRTAVVERHEAARLAHFQAVAEEWRVVHHIAARNVLVGVDKVFRLRRLWYHREAHVEVGVLGDMAVADAHGMVYKVVAEAVG